MGLPPAYIGVGYIRSPRNRGSAAPRNCIKPCADALQNVVSSLRALSCARCFDQSHARRRRVRFFMMSGDPLIFFSLLRQAPLTKRSQRAVFSREFSS